jgi:hypothetical protein
MKKARVTLRRDETLSSVPLGHPFHGGLQGAPTYIVKIVGVRTMRSYRRLFLCLLFAFAEISGGRAASGAASALQPPSPAAGSVTELTPELRARILTAMRLNRQTFQEDAVLKRYGETRPPITEPALVACDLPRTASGAPASQYPAAQARSKPRPYTEAKVADCLGTTGGLSGTRAAPLAQHYYCTLPGLSPDIRGCFTFQLRLPSVSRTRSVWDDAGYLPDGTKLPLEKGWNFLGPDPAVVPDAAAAFGYCATDGRPHTINTLKKGKRVPVEVSKVHPTPTRPMCWIVQTQADIFQGIMGGTINVPTADQVSLLREYYDCKRIKSKVSAARFKALCEFDTE